MEPVTPAPPAPPGPTPTVHHAAVLVGSRRTDYLRLGRGAPVLWLCGRDDPPEPVTGLANLLAANFSITVPVTMGFGPAPDTPTIEAYADWIVEFLDGLGIDRVAIVCDVLSSSITLTFASRHRGRVDRIILLIPGRPEEGDQVGRWATLMTRVACPVLIVPDRGRQRDDRGTGVTTGVPSRALATIAADMTAFLRAGIGTGRRQATDCAAPIPMRNSSACSDGQGSVGTGAPLPPAGCASE